MPGLRLTPAQAARLLGLNRRVCHRVIEALVGAEFLRQGARRQHCAPGG